MPPKAVKSKVPATSAQFLFTQRSSVPAPAPLPPFRRPHRPMALLLIRRGVANHLVAITVTDGKLGAKNVISGEPLTFSCAACDLNDVHVTKVSPTDGCGAALAATKSHGVLVVGALHDESHEIASSGANVLVVRHASQFKGSDPAASDCCLAIACSHRHGVALCVDNGTKATKVVGYGFTDMGALGIPPPALSSVYATDGLGLIPRPTLDPHDGALALRRFQFGALGTFSSATPLDVFVSRHITCVSTPEGLLMVGTLAQHCNFQSPRLVLRGRRSILSVVVLHDAVYALEQGNRVWKLSIPDGSEADTPCPTIDDDGQPVFYDATEMLFGGAIGDETPRGSASSALLPGAQLSCLRGGSQHCVAVDTANGAVYGWGSNAFGQLGTPSHCMLRADEAVRIPVDGTFASVHAFQNTTLLLNDSCDVVARFGR